MASGVCQYSLTNPQYVQGGDTACSTESEVAYLAFGELVQVALQGPNTAGGKQIQAESSEPMNNTLLLPLPKVSTNESHLLHKLGPNSRTVTCSQHTMQ